MPSGPGKNDWEEKRRLEEVDVKVHTPGRLGTNCLVQVRAYLAVSGPPGVQLVPGVSREISGGAVQSLNT